MRYRKLHNTDLQLSELGFGTWTVSTGWWGNYTDEEAQRIICRAIDHGINYIDTADAYGNGRGETILAPILKDHPELIVGTKFGYDFYNNPERPRGQRELPPYQSDKSGYDLHFEDLFYASVATSGPAMVTIAGTNITVRQSLTVGDIAPIRPTCISETIGVGALLPGTHHLTWIYDVGYTVVGGPTQILTREMTFDVQAPRRRTSAR